MAAFFLGCNRNKRSIVLDLKKEEGRAALLKLAEDADVLDGQALLQLPAPLQHFEPQRVAALGSQLGPDRRGRGELVHRVAGVPERRMIIWLAPKWPMRS